MLEQLKVENQMLRVRKMETERLSFESVDISEL